MSAAALLEDLAAADMRIVREGDLLRVRASQGVDLDVHTTRIRDAKPAILAELRLRERIVVAATVDPADFDRDTYDRLWQEWHEHQENAR